MQTDRPHLKNIHTEIPFGFVASLLERHFHNRVLKESGDSYANIDAARERKIQLPSHARKTDKLFVVSVLNEISTVEKEKAKHHNNELKEKQHAKGQTTKFSFSQVVT